MSIARCLRRTANYDECLKTLDVAKKLDPNYREIYYEAALTNLLLTAPEAPIRLGSGELSIYKDIATMDQGPGYLNGVLSLILNTTGPASEYSLEEQRAIPYFHRARAAELLALLDSNFPESASRPELHAKLLEFYATAGKSEAVLKGGAQFRTAFPKSPERTSVALLMADADARLKKTQDEFAIYDWSFRNREQRLIACHWCASR
jgi:hypothetical protein